MTLRHFIEALVPYDTAEENMAFLVGALCGLSVAGVAVVMWLLGIGT